MSDGILRSVLLAGLLTLAACGTPATKEDFDAVTAGMSRTDVDKALDRLGGGEPSDAKAVLQVFGGMEGGQFEILKSLTVVRWGTSKEPLFVGFDGSHAARMKVVFTPHFRAITPFPR